VALVHRLELEELQRLRNDLGRREVGEVKAGLRDGCETTAIASRPLCVRKASSTHQLVMLQNLSGLPRTGRSA